MSNRRMRPFRQYLKIASWDCRTRKNSHCWVLSIARVVMGFGMGFIGGIYIAVRREYPEYRVFNIPRSTGAFSRTA